MSVGEFRRGYWLAVELKAFARALGIAGTARLRKDQLEALIEDVLRTGKMKQAAPQRTRGAAQPDTERGLSLRLRVVRYTSNRQTKDFLEREALRLRPGFRRRSGARYRLNRWREEQLAHGNPITYGDLVRKYVELNAPETKYKRIPTGRYINFLADYLKRERGATHAAARRAWHELKSWDIPKDYRHWKKEAHRHARAPSGE